MNARKAMRVTFLVFFAGVAAGQQFGQGVSDYSAEKEKALGGAISLEMTRRTTPVDDPQIQTFIQRTGERLASHVTSVFPWTFAVVSGLPAHPTHEPVSVPGGYIFVPADLILIANNEDEFAGMLARAMAHEAIRDTARAASMSRGMNSGPLIFMDRWIAGGLMPAAQAALEKTLEEDADARALRIMLEAGFNPEALVSYIACVQPEGPDHDYGLPERQGRLAAMRTVLEKLRFAGSNNAGFLDIQQRLRRLTGETSSPARSLLRPGESIPPTPRH